MKLVRLLTAFAATPWAMLPERLEAAIAVLNDAATRGHDLPVRAEIEGSMAAQAGVAVAADGKPGGSAQQQSVVAVIPVWGIISHRAHMVEDICGPGGTSTEKLSRAINGAIADRNVKALVLDVDSPGGSVFGVQEVADEIYKARGTKPILASANSLAASAAYWIAAAADELFVTPSGEVGSIGVYAAHVDVSKSQELKGLKTTLVSAGKYKVEGHPYAPLEAEAAAQMQARVNDYYDAFTKAVGKYRGVGVEAVRSGFGEGRTVGAKQAVAEGMANGVETLQETINRAAKLARQAERQGAAGSRALADARIALVSAA